MQPLKMAGSIWGQQIVCTDLFSFTAKAPIPNRSLQLVLSQTDILQDTVSIRHEARVGNLLLNMFFLGFWITFHVDHCKVFYIKEGNSLCHATSQKGVIK